VKIITAIKEQNTEMLIIGLILGGILAGTTSGEKFLMRITATYSTKPV